MDLLQEEEEIFALASKFDCPVFIDPYQATLMQQRLVRRGIRCIEFPFTAESRRKLFGRLLDLIEDGRIKVRSNLDLKKQLLGLVAKRLPSGGWRIDHKALEADDGEVVYAIPSPRRRTEKGWVFDPVPLIAGKAEAEAAE